MTGTLRILISLLVLVAIPSGAEVYRYNNPFGIDYSIVTLEDTGSCYDVAIDGRIQVLDDVCSWDLQQGISLFLEDITLELSQAQLTTSRWTTDYGEYRLQVLHDLRWLSLVYPKVYAIELFRERPVSSYYRILYSETYGVIGFGVSVREGENQGYEAQYILQGRCGFGHRCPPPG